MAFHGEIKFSREAFRAAWADTETTTKQIAAAFNMSPATANRVAQAMGLPARKKGARLKMRPDLFRAMWLAGVSVAEIVAHFRVDDATVTNTVQRLGVGSRPCLTLDDFKAGLLARAMARSAAIEQRQIKLAEMADNIRPNAGREGGRRAA